MLAKEIGASFYEVSAKSGDGVHAVIIIIERMDNSANLLAILRRCNVSCKAET